MVSEEQIKNFKVENGTEPIYVQAYYQQSSFEIFSIPHTPGNLLFDKEKKDIVITDKEFFVAVTVNQLDNSAIDLPLCVSRVSIDNWK